MASSTVEFRLDRAGVGEVLRSQEVRAMVDGAASQIAERIRAQVPAGVEVEVRTYTTDRAAATVAVPDRRAMGWQARDGLLTRAAAAIGAEVKPAGG